MKNILTLALLFVALTAHSAPRIYPKSGTCDMEKVYHVDKSKDATLRGLKYTEAMAKDSFPAFAAYWQARGWPTAELLDLYLFECAWNDWVWHTDTYLDVGIYIRPNFITQSRGTIIAPDGDYYVRYGCMTGLGHYIGRHPNVYAEKTGTNIGSTPGTSIRIDHFGWSKRQPDRNCMYASCWGMDYGVIGGMAYSEGVQVEGFRFVGGRNEMTNDPTFVSNGLTMSHPGENSVVAFCMAEGFNNAGYAIIGGTPGVVEVCSAFYNCGPGFDFLGNNGLTNMTGRTLSGDNNRGGLIRIRPMNAQSVGGGTFTFISTKSESRGVMQRMVSVEGPLGQLTLNIIGGTADYNGVTCDELIHVDQGEYEVNVTGVQISSNVGSLFYCASTGVRLTGGRASRGNTFGLNNEVGLYLKSRSNMVLSTGGVVTPPVDPGPVTPPASGLTATAFASTSTNPASMAVDGNPATYWMSGVSMTTTSQTVTLKLPAAASVSTVTFTIPPTYDNSYPRTFTVSTSTNGSTFTSRGSFTGLAISTATFTPVQAGWVRITCTTANGNWWGISEVTVK
jgi:hypothetical protein